MPVLDVHGLSIRFGELQALVDVDLRVDEFEIVGLIGPNGAGKTTCFNCVTGFYRPQNGRVVFQGDDVSDLMIEHHVPLVVRVCDYVYVLNFGRLLTEGLPRQVQTHPEVVAAYLGEEAPDAEEEAERREAVQGTER